MNVEPKIAPMLEPLGRDFARREGGGVDYRTFRKFIHGVHAQLGNTLLHIDGIGRSRRTWVIMPVWRAWKASMQDVEREFRSEVLGRLASVESRLDDVEARAGRPRSSEVS